MEKELGLASWLEFYENCYRRLLPTLVFAVFVLSFVFSFLTRRPLIVGVSFFACFIFLFLRAISSNFLMLRDSLNSFYHRFNRYLDMFLGIPPQLEPPIVSGEQRIRYQAYLFYRIFSFGVWLHSVGLALFLFWFLGLAVASKFSEAQFVNMKAKMPVLLVFLLRLYSPDSASLIFDHLWYILTVGLEIVMLVAVSFNTYYQHPVFMEEYRCLKDRALRASKLVLVSLALSSVAFIVLLVVLGAGRPTFYLQQFVHKLEQLRLWENFSAFVFSVALAVLNKVLNRR